MANTSAVCTSFKVLLMKGQMDFTASTGDSFKIAMFDSDATLSASTTDYSTSEEITNTSGTAYTAGGEALTNVTPVSSRPLHIQIFLQTFHGRMHLLRQTQLLFIIRQLAQAQEQLMLWQRLRSVEIKPQRQELSQFNFQQQQLLQLYSE